MSLRSIVLGSLTTTCGHGVKVSDLKEGSSSLLVRDMATAVLQGWLGASCHLLTHLASLSAGLGFS